MDEWKLLAINRINEMIETLKKKFSILERLFIKRSTFIWLGDCPVCVYMKGTYNIKTHTPYEGCFNEDRTIECPAIKSCLRFTEIRNNLKTTPRTKIRLLKELIKQLK